MLTTFIDLTALFFFSLTSLFLMRKVAKSIDLVDKPNHRKQHERPIPLVGGISICPILLFFLFNNQFLIPQTTLYASCVIVLVVVGALDDRFDIDYKLRFGIQAAISISMMMQGNVELHTIGNILGAGDVNLGWLGYFVTILAVVGTINAFNMVDGIDGLLGGLSIVTFSGLGIMLIHDNQNNLAYLCLVMIVIILPYILFNVGAFGRKRKVFMGDAGSMVIGFTVIWLLLLSSQNGKTPPLQPVTALWLIALPLMDMVSIMFRRISRGDSPFKPDREHLHHIFQRLGFSSKQTILIICFTASLISGVGILSEIYEIPEYIRFYGFIILFLVYFFSVKKMGEISHC
ncbi:UDP-N-acetylglucosamine--undecaprenyl-phosphate N-acetylglucosaminephosphotransferase [Vibrio fluvialis]|uniref:UDP-N-acetylglucosamine--undecaprenyl-phosphate N-acetylglucosaminephosphotransferase n=1 Tax=Vibrio fluvialis TaxID=676 RepID=UPI001C9D6573|nr:UDP-N-acetylglucosamine--undecaprenyl-phosphate N-acetylglucosaminephosphotransferase [Vibrio fluvialis]MBY7854795.1 UDP-N-acetylglucosamine--undecaprenyl-phosphate N-acetylglucosaminephosphotransferase [Vibrio fluvialis]MBY7924271.1 UDP-N-acetylglucosamine--undecaprenyl-phosphate N-acetylglucosaminephosphotransferase [Vibrio fluvialis]MBY7980049.1 UDP-N-acetylglucosamine--undecaprenyl-phosphate N-acetylglucosaminephosphotransferase [Vibrio fluvialis]MBY8258204.1 UDP-N-acetylglucosamine--und